MTKKVRRAPQQQLTRKQRSRLQEERRVRRILMWSVGLVGVLVVGILGYGVVAERIIQPREPVATVDDAAVTTAELEKRVKFRRLQLQNQLAYLYQQQQTMAAQSTESGAQSMQQYFQEQINSLQSQLAAENAEALGQQVLAQLIQEKLVRQEAERRGISVSPAEIQSAIHENFGYDPDATPIPTPEPPLTSTESLTAGESAAAAPPSMTEEDFQEVYNRYIQDGLRPLGISEEDFRSWTQASLLTEALQADMKDRLPQEADQVKLRFLTANSEERAQELAERLDAGEDFEEIAEEIQADEESPGLSSELDWLPQDVMADRLNEELATTIFELDVGAHTDPVKLGEESETYYVFEVTGHEERELSDSILQQMAQERFQSWLEAQQSLVERKPIAGKVPTEP